MSFDFIKLSMRTLKRKVIPFIVLLIMLFLSSADAQQNSKLLIPNFNTTECREFQSRLLKHTLLSTHDRAHSTNLGIAGASLFWSGLPALPLGISAIILGRRQSTPAVRELLLSGVTTENFEEINILCSILIKEPPIVDASLDGMNRRAIILGSFATAMASFVLIIQILFVLCTYWKLRSCEYDTETVLSNVEGVIKRNLSLKSGDGKSDENEMEGNQGGHDNDDMIHGAQRGRGGVRILHNESLDTIDEMICVSEQQ